MKIKNVAMLIHYIGYKDNEDAKCVIETMINEEKAKQNNNAAQLLQRAYSCWGSKAKLIELPTEIKQYTYAQEPTKRLKDVYLSSDILNNIKTIMDEYNQLDMIRKADLPPRNKILLAGPPGNGKTSLAEAISNELELKFIKVNMAELITSTLGGIAKNINNIFNGVNKCEKCLLFLDEIDSIGVKRYENTDDSCAHEWANSVNTLLTSIDMLSDDALLICATNLPEKLDPALLRRFKIKLWLNPPTSYAINKYVTNYQNNHKVDFGNIGIDRLSGQPWSKIEDFCQNLHRSIVLGTNQTTLENIWIGKEV